MSGLQVTVPLQLLCRLMIAAQVGENMTLPSIRNSSLAETTDSRELPSGYVEFPEFGFAYKRSMIKLSHNDARKSCLEEGGQLAVIDSREKVEKINNHFVNSPGWVGLGMGSFYGTSEWITVDGKSTNNLPWKIGDPSGAGKCAYLSQPWSGLMNFDCSNTEYFLCEIALPRN